MNPTGMIDLLQNHLCPVRRTVKPDITLVDLLLPGFRGCTESRTPEFGIAEQVFGLAVNDQV